MALAAGFGHHAGFGFGLGFLNLIGTVLFFLFIFWALKMVARGMRYSSGRGGFGFGPGFGCGSRKPSSEDEAMKVARERLANSELSPEEFTTLKEGLRTSTPHDEERPYRRDGALSTARMRFAQGEISRVEFEAVKKALLG